MFRNTLRSAPALLLLFITSTTAEAAPQGRRETIADALASQDFFTQREDDAGLDQVAFYGLNWYDYDILFAAVLLDETLVPAVTDPATGATLLAPNDRAFQKLAFDLTGKMLWTEQEVLQAIVGAVESGAVNLTNVLTYHVIGSRVARRQLPFSTDIPTLNGETLRFERRFFGLLVEIQDNAAAFENPFLLRTDIDAGNSVVHGISRVLIPSNVGG